MNSHFGWVDYASENKNKMLDVVKLFREKDTRDELGIGTIRDAFSDYFFPGTSTIQTRARYFLFVPWIYRELEKKEITYPEIANKAHENEIKLIYALLKSDDHYGLIGGDVKSALQRLPSEIYWTGLNSWGIRLFQGSRDQYHRSLTRNYYKNKDFYETERNMWDPGLPEPPDNFLKKTKLPLRKEDAEYLVDKISCNNEGTLLFYLVNEQVEPKTKYFWKLSIINELPQKLKKNIMYARNFTETIHGASLLYNYLLASKKEDEEELIIKYQKRLEKWSDKITSRWSELSYWYENINEFWSSKVFIEDNIPYSTMNFVDTWLEIIFSGNNIMNITENKDAKTLIKNREYKLKRKRARLWNQRALEMWGGASGTAPLDYRWGNAKLIIQDILDGLKGGA